MDTTYVKILNQQSELTQFFIYFTPIGSFILSIFLLYLGYRFSIRKDRVIEKRRLMELGLYICYIARVLHENTKIQLSFINDHIKALKEEEDNFLDYLRINVEYNTLNFDVINKNDIYKVFVENDNGNMYGKSKVVKSFNKVVTVTDNVLKGLLSSREAYHDEMQKLESQLYDHVEVVLETINHYKRNEKITSTNGEITIYNEFNKLVEQSEIDGDEGINITCIQYKVNNMFIPLYKVALDNKIIEIINLIKPMFSILETCKELKEKYVKIYEKFYSEANRSEFDMVMVYGFFKEYRNYFDWDAEFKVKVFNSY